ncbi:unnamed protein product [Rhizophagus irregularis]|nr:unnamed protein product [Rhizophagus irregularis]
MGVPLENALTTKRAEIQLTLPVCPTSYVYTASLCDEIDRLMVFCENSQNPDDDIVVYNDCGPDETCIEHYHAVKSDLDVMYATCIDNEIGSENGIILMIPLKKLVHRKGAMTLNQLIWRLK